MSKHRMGQYESLEDERDRLRHEREQLRHELEKLWLQRSSEIDLLNTELRENYMTASQVQSISEDIRQQGDYIDDIPG